MNDQIELYSKLLGLQSARFSLIEHVDAMVAIVYRIYKSDGEELILKICDRVNDYLREVHFLKFFAGKIPVPRIVNIVEPKEGIHGAILMECLKGTLLQTHELSEELAIEIGQSLGTIHLAKLQGFGDPVQNDLSLDPRTYFTFKFEEGLNECLNHLSADLIEKCRLYHEKHINSLLTADGPCTVHRDFRPGNLIVDNNKLQGVIDWAGARASFAEEDLCSLEHGEWSNHLKYKKAILKGYESVRKIPDYNHLVPFLRLNRAIATMGFLLKRGIWNGANSSLYQYNLDFVKSLV